MIVKPYRLPLFLFELNCKLRILFAKRFHFQLEVPCLHALCIDYAVCAVPVKDDKICHILSGAVVFICSCGNNKPSLTAESFYLSCFLQQLKRPVKLSFLFAVKAYTVCPYLCCPVFILLRGLTW